MALASNDEEIKYVTYTNETQMELMMKLIEKDLSEPYSVYTYRYFLNNWPELCILAFHKERMVGTIVAKLEPHKGLQRGYIAMLAVDSEYRKKSIGTSLVVKCINTMKEKNCDQVVLETEVSNTGAIALYLRLGFLKEKRLQRYYLNAGDAFRLKLWIKA